MTETSGSDIVSTRQQRIAELARQAPQRGLTSLNHYLDLTWLYEAYHRTRETKRGRLDFQSDFGPTGVAEWLEKVL
jgi:hypothetical protein